MTDITELAQSEINDALAQLKQLSEYPTPSTQYARVLRKYFSSLVEALEKAQRANSAQDDHINQQQGRIEQLEKGQQHAAKHINNWRRLAKQNIAEREKDISELEAARGRIAELESRTVKLPALPRLGANTEWYQGFAAGAEGMRSDCAHAIAATGIKVEAE